MAEVIEFETERLRLRQWRESDLAPFAALNADPKVMEFFPEPLSRQASDEMAQKIRSLIEQRGWGFWAVEVKGGASFIGFVGLHVPAARVPMANKEEVVAFMATEFPQNKCELREVGNCGATVIRQIGPEDLRPGGTVSGPVLIGVADVALYAAILGEIGIVPLAVTTSLTINFLRKPSASRSIVGVCKLMKIGKSLAVGEVELYSEGMSDPVAHVVGTYSIPPRREL